MPYDYKIIKIYKKSAKQAFNLESKLKKQNIKHQYLPKLIFNGRYECYSIINKL
jgi:hypothetical protein